MDGRLFVALTASSCLAATGQLLLKIGADRISGLLSWFNPYLLLGLGCYGASVILWLYGLSKAPLHIVYPFTMLTFILVGLASIAFLGERPGASAIVGWGVVLVGIFVIYFGSKHT